MSESIDSAVLTATIKIIKVLQSVQNSQENVAEVMSAIKKGQDDTRSNINHINDLPDKDDFMQLVRVVKATNDKLSSIHTEISNISELIDNRISSMNKNIHKLIGDSETHLSSEIARSNSAENLQTIKRLIQGLQNMQTNMTEVAKRIETLSQNVDGVRKDTRTLSGTIIDSNSRVKSMDLRMGEFVTLVDDDVKTSKASKNTLGDMLNLLTSLDKNQNLNDDIKHLSGEDNPGEVIHDDE